MNCPLLAYILQRLCRRNRLKKKIKWILTGIMVLALIILCKKMQEHIAGSNVPESRVIVIDAGHGAEDPGKVGVSGELEKEINLQIAKKVQEKLEAEGITVVMTREDDKGFYGGTQPYKKLTDMKKRVALINETAPEVVVSIHQNSFSDGSVRGPQVFYYAESEQGEQFASVMQEELWNVDTEHKREIKANDNYYILKHTEVPTIIVECGFLSNYEEAKMLTEDSYQETVAQAIHSGIIKWLDK